MLVEELKNRKINAIYNHGAFTKTDRGQKLRTDSFRKPMELTTLSYFADLIADTRSFIIPALLSGYVIIQDRYIDAITTYIAAYGKTEGRECDVYEVAEVFTENGVLLIPDMRIFCIPQIDIVIERIKTSKTSEVHDLYRRKPELLEMVYAEIFRMSEAYPNSRVINTVSSEVAYEATQIIADILIRKVKKDDC